MNIFRSPVIDVQPDVNDLYIVRLHYVKRFGRCA
jgi:hypothetical protein